MKFKIVYLQQFSKTLLQKNITLQTNCIFMCRMALFAELVFKRVRSSETPRLDGN